MDKVAKEFVKICAETLPILEPVYEFGSHQGKEQEGFADLRPFFPNKKYVGADIIKGVGVDITLNLHNINLDSESVGTVVMVGTLEHVEFPRKAIAEIYKILNPNGIFILHSVMNHPYHSAPDYWRFTPDAFESLLRDFTTVIIDFAGEKKFPEAVIAVASKRILDDKVIKLYKDRICLWKAYCHKIVRPRLSRLLLPPILYGLDRKIKKAWLRRKEKTKINKSRYR